MSITAEGPIFQIDTYVVCKLNADTSSNNLHKYVNNYASLASIAAGVEFLFVFIRLRSRCFSTI